jgi:RNA-directed DNA polymerase
MRFHLRRDLSFTDIAKMVNTKVGAWAAYFGHFSHQKPPTSCSTSTGTWCGGPSRKYKHLRRAPRRAARILAGIKRTQPGLLAHWRWEISTRTAAIRTG